jgi:GNAT superfamily N-acetyltransferase
MYIDHIGDENQTVADFKQQIAKSLSDGASVLLTESGPSGETRGFLLFNLNSNSMHTLFANLLYKSERTLFDEILKRYPNRVPKIVFQSGYPTPWISEGLAKYSQEIGFIEHVRGYMRLEPIIAESLQAVKSADGIEFVEFNESKKSETAELVYRCVEGSIDQALFPSIYSSPATIEKFFDDLLSGKYGNHKSGYSWILQNDSEYIGACFMVTRQEIGFLVHIVIDPKQREKGLGRILLVHTIKNLQQSDKRIKRIELAVTWSNPARFLYDSLGFTLVNKSSTFVWKG